MDPTTHHILMRRALLEAEIAAIKRGGRCFIGGVILGTAIGALVIHLLS